MIEIQNVYKCSHSFSDNVVYMCKNAQQRLYGLLRKLRSFGASNHILESAYHCLVESILTSNLVTWYRNLSLKNRAQLAWVINTASKIVGSTQKQLGDLFCLSVGGKSLSSLSSLTEHILSTPASNICRWVGDSKCHSQRKMFIRDLFFLLLFHF